MHDLFAHVRMKTSYDLEETKEFILFECDTHGVSKFRESIFTHNFFQIKLFLIFFKFHPEIG